MEKQREREGGGGGEGGRIRDNPTALEKGTFVVACAEIDRAIEENSNSGVYSILSNGDQLFFFHFTSGEYAE